MDASGTIIAVASPPGVSPKGLLRISGEHALDLASLIMVDSGASPSRSIHATRLVDQLHGLPGMVITYPGPRSYTGEDLIEILLPGNPHLLEDLVDRMIRIGAEASIEVRRATGGEFTFRAYLNGKLDLAEAEGVAAMISAENDGELEAARLLLDGKVSRVVMEASSKLTGLLALVEAGIDFTDQEDVVPIEPGDLLDGLVGLEASLEQLLENRTGGERIQAMPWVVLRGEPNAGKSSLLNALLDRKRAVVSQIHGTTRDVIMEPLKIEDGHGAIEIMLVDMAGLDHDDKGLNPAMQRAAETATNRADLVLDCVEASRPVTGDRPGDGCLLVRTKSDLGTSGQPGLHTSVIDGTGIQELKTAIRVELQEVATSIGASMLRLEPRQRTALESARAHLGECIRILEPARCDHALPDVELVATLCRTALDAIGTVTGQVSPDDVLGEIFSGFCVGK
ncbi:MAG: hypothetical protein CMJ32_05925 [Phycisphaerae bacterium]|nr:hypothetical protein [Phycisphaerae bacterium]